MLVESLASKAGACSGRYVDGTPFKHAGKPEGAADEFGHELVKAGYNYHGSEVMVNGMLGTEMPAEIFIGSVYYQRLRHMVSDKFQVRSCGPVNKMTHQPIKGRKLGGGIRFGEMERDSLLAHGAAYLLHDRLHSCSDRHIANVCSTCGSLLAPTVVGTGISLSNLAAADGSRGTAIVCRLCDSPKGVEKVALPYVFKYLASELAAMNIRISLTLKK
ncbi:hypothetical protein CYMTET_13534 [Cymbomonas tetramitiformis]|uniref:DNA-directed RNA polymerase n=1 Tax=Cymbomonas tetramitiformis TaxID=36881 RepID=A0AAE0GHX9_9CHLO|nr:hypothetical protein CYMTET_13534 [Cymbomonas tetramitiformis]